MQSAAVVQSHPYNTPAGGVTQEAATNGNFNVPRMTKRRRVEDRALSSWADQHGPEVSSQRLSDTQVVQRLATADAQYSAAVADNGGSALNDSSEAPGQWSSTGPSPYPDVSSYQQPYFYQQTDPSIYNSPWPPMENTSYGAPTSYSLVSQAGMMPFFPTQTPPEPNNENSEAPVTSYQNLQDVDPSPQYAYAAHQSRNETSQQASTLYFDDASMHLKIQSLSILDNLATQLIHTIAKASFPQIQDLMRSTDNEESQAYITLKNLFDQTRKVYSRETPFIDAIAIQMFQPSQQEIIRKANIATFVSSILGAHDVSFFHLNEFFMETFVPLGHRLLKWQGAVLLDLKTQTYISALMNSDGSPEAMLDELFPPDLDAQILTRHPDAPSLSPSEQDFIDRSRARKTYLLAEPSTQDALKELPKKYQWNDFVKEFASCITKNVDGIMNVPARAQPAFGGANAADRRVANAAQSAQESAFGPHALLSKTGQPRSPAVALALNGAGLLAPGQSGTSGPSSSEGAKKTSASSSTTRQPWTKPEEDALLLGLDQVNGPHWSQILALYGRGGSISEILKDRNQVQLKDKARNLKLWYLKMGKDVPVALCGVTGELRKRGGARARAAMGLLDDDEQAGAGGQEGGDADDNGGGENIDPVLESARPSRSKKKSGRK